MQVETYEVNEINSAGEVEKFDEQAIALIEKLGLSGQRDLIRQPSDSGRMVIPYQEMTAQEVDVYLMLFPQRTDATAYGAGPIPVRVLQVIAFAQGLFSKLQIWHKATGQAKDDPVLVGINGTWPEKTYLLARWGDALHPFSELVKQAGTVARSALAIRLGAAKADIDRDLATIATLPDGYAAGWCRRGPSYHDNRPSSMDGMPF